VLNSVSKNINRTYHPIHAPRESFYFIAVSLMSLLLLMTFSKDAYAHLATDPDGITVQVIPGCTYSDICEGISELNVTSQRPSEIGQALVNRFRTIRIRRWETNGFPMVCFAGRVSNNPFLLNPDLTEGTVTLVYDCEPSINYVPGIGNPGIGNPGNITENFYITRVPVCDENHYSTTGSTQCNYYSTLPPGGIDISIADINNFVNNVTPYTPELWDDIVSKILVDTLAGKDMTLADGDLLLDRTKPTTVLDEGLNSSIPCLSITPVIELVDQRITAKVAGDTVLTLSAEGVRKRSTTNAEGVRKLSAAADLKFDVKFVGTIKIRFRNLPNIIEALNGECGKLTASIPIYANATGSTGNIKLGLALDYIYHKETRIGSVLPRISLSGEITNISQFTVTYNVGDWGDLLTSAISKIIEVDILAKEVNNILNSKLLVPQVNKKIEKVLAKRQTDLEETIKLKLAALQKFYIPDINEFPEEIIEFLLKGVAKFTALPISRAYIESRKDDILVALLTGDTDALKLILLNTAACTSSKLALANMSSMPVYTYSSSTGSCVQADVEGVDTSAYFTDSLCQNSIDFKPQDYIEFCKDYTDPTALGNPASWRQSATHLEQPWTVSPETQFYGSVKSISGNKQPYMKKVHYRTVATTIDDPDQCDAQGNNCVQIPAECQLEIRIFKKDLSATNLTPIIDIHGGGFNTRRPYIGSSMQFSHMTERDYIVFSPFYRLVSDDDAGPECHNSDFVGFTQDVEAALQWVLKNGIKYGAKPVNKIAVTGLSAGGALSAWLATHDTTRDFISRAYLRYPVTDLKYLLAPYAGAQNDSDIKRCSDSFDADGSCAANNYIEEFTYGSVRNVVGSELRLVPPTHPAVTQGTVTDVVALAPDQFPPMFIIHGRSDQTLPSSQSVRLCNALSGSGPDYNLGPASNMLLPGELHKQFSCNSNGSVLHLVRNSAHVMDICEVGTKCLGPNANSKSIVSNIMEAAWDWLDPQPVIAPPPVVTPPPVVIPPAAGADLTSSISSVPNTVITGTRVPIAFSISNIGTDFTNNTVTGLIFVSKDTIWDSADQSVGFGGFNLGNFSGGQSMVVNKDILIPGNLQPGTYYILVISDYNNYVIEVDDPDNRNGNNLSFSTPVSVAIP